MYQQVSGQPKQEPENQSAATGFSTSYSSSAPYSADNYSYQQPPLSLPKPPVEWSTGLCGCFSDFKNCCITCWCPCITFGQVAEIVDKGSTSCGASGALYTLICCVNCCGCFYSCFYRSKMRQQHNLMGNNCLDCLTHCFCEICALCQEYRELENRGFDMVIGWHGNVEQRSRGVAMSVTAPTVEEGMSR
ncbi:hypothetical protein TanjilG_32815 [Lupinus angustifolius]|uniref:Uncharacterized protein n=1 Tax=Lupinus angustifolius TaxID=3871 RepID=A0A4P1RG35_LUPAN|nr:PREDICTED: protein PLANT CADMIUM RESISTANCE 2-like [Lupinus angustifolius]XP_019446230.1 PREDICTED: protein PLANT CADMIUM RESISTANCE 2-like [Lupinus angustifolius]XP_019446231.1 PREDICTED: protein PLANT CADMIUM RESISTANCE 2-like [Lupinus angustifolius]OIW10075.1 hypothetical protein TanjilG_32815 [Lupinus angustifolius]